MPQLKISTQAAVLSPTPGSESRNSSDSSPRCGLGPVEVGRLAERSRIAWMRGAFCGPEAAGADRLLDLGERRVAHCLPGRESFSQRGEGAIAVAIVGVLGEDGLDQLMTGCPMRLIQRAPVHLPQSIPNRPHPRLAGPFPRPRRATLTRWAVNRELQCTGCPGLFRG